MKIIILAAGIGSRLGNPFPKPLTPLADGTSLMERQVENISKYFDINDIIVVVGFKKELIMERFHDLTFVYNPFFDTTNTAKSLLKAIQRIDNESVLWFNGDVVFDESLLSELQQDISKNTSFIAVNKARVAEEEVKYTLQDGYINQLSKEVQNGMGEAVGINFLSSDDINVVISRLEMCDENDYFEKALENAIRFDDLKVKPIDISSYNCIEVDCTEDLAIANKIFLV